jgi:C4-dicarboxylate transporter DctQ subunit
LGLKLPGKLQIFFDDALRFLAYIASALILIGWIIVCAEIVMRYFFKHPLTWVVEFTEYIMLYSTFLGAAWLLKEEGHVNVNLVTNKLSPKTQVILSFVTSILGIAACAVIGWYGTKSTLSQYAEGIRTFTAMLLLKWPFVMIIPIGSFLLCFQFMRRAYGYWERLAALRKKNE